MALASNELRTREMKRIKLPFVCSSSFIKQRAVTKCEQMVYFCSENIFDSVEYHGEF